MGKFNADYSNLPHHKSAIDWQHSVGYSFSFNYNDGQVVGQMKILDYKKENTSRYVLLQYNDIIEWCGLRAIMDNNIRLSMLGLVRDYTKQNHRKPKQTRNIGEIIHTDISDLKIIGIGIRTPQNGALLCSNPNSKSVIVYQVLCSKCGCISTKSQRELIAHPNCPVCCGKDIIPGVNDITAKAPWMIDFFQGGVHEAKQYTPCSNVSIIPKCPICGKVSQNMAMINDIYRNGSFKCECSDHNSYPEKYMAQFLDQLGVDYNYQYSSCKINPNAEYKIYDFYIAKYQMIIEAHGMQHYGNGFEYLNGITLEEIKKNDIIKEQIARENGIYNYIVIDARQSHSDYIKNSILKSQLPKILGFHEEDINWRECDIYATKNIVKEICMDYMDNLLSIPELSEKYHRARPTIVKSLKKGYDFGWCYYDNKYRDNSIILKVTVAGKTMYTLGINDTIEFINKETNGGSCCAETFTSMLKRHQKLCYKNIFSYEVVTNELEKALAIRNKLEIKMYRSINKRLKRRKKYEDD